MKILTIVMALMVLPFTARAACEEIPFENQRNICFALTTSDISYCNKIRDNDFRFYCLAKFKNEKSYCKRVSNRENRKVCLAELKKSSKNRK